ncbi:hypothetical protein [Modestobacter roseus]|uniref:Uncharacterized protein with LGFP repeats n=1 Tax=Modestobacter roseus TaxID=1181884 RepID=A0A562IU43_9ACTN|nr:hypothetical protein [Modestobacter roseus]MQA33270.1 hypothetical protein [Modestobacter roseus]TWH74195.1 uncharacterized protein with LGFP repeats [Modestobacter roseus]
MNRLRRLLTGVLVVLCSAVVVTGLVSGGAQVPSVDPVEAADTGQFRPGNIISDQLFFDGNAMDAGAVQAFLNSKNPTCKVGNDGTACLKDYRADTYAKPADDRCPGAYAGAPAETAAAIIAKVGRACGISQRVLLVILQKEQSLVTASGSSLYPRRYREAMGFACPDTAPCRPEYNGFFNQVYSAAWQYRNYAANPTRYNYRAGLVNNLRYHPNADCGSAPVFIENQATAGLYNYTPYQPNAAALNAGKGTGDGCSAYGNRNFWIYYTDWFGSTQIPGAAQVTGRWAELGGATGRLGNLTGDVVCGLAGGGCYQPYANGAIYWSPATGARFVLLGAVRDKWGSLGWEAGPLGWPVRDALCGLPGGGCFQEFQTASVYWSPSTGAHTVGSQVREKWGTTGWEGGFLGYPVTDQTAILGGGAAYAHFQGGSVYWSPATGAHVLGGVVYDRWATSGWENGSLGLPVTDLAVAPDKVGLYAHFQRGSIYWTPSTGARALSADLYRGWAATGWEAGALGYPVSDAATTPDGKAQYAHFQRGSLYASAATGAHPVSGAVRDAWAASGWENGPLGLPVAGPGRTPDGKATYQHFQGGSVYSSTATGTWVVPVAVRDGWAAAGWEVGPLGYPTASAVATADGRGQVQSFQGGEVYASAATGGRAVPAALLGAYQAAGGAGGPLGFPVSASGTTPDGKATYQHFQGGSVYATTTGTWVLPTVVRNAWAAAGWERGALGYPTSAAVPTSDGRGQVQSFQGGQVFASAATGGHSVPAALLGAYGVAGGPAGTLGFPVSGAGKTPDGVASYQHFERGSIYATAATGARVVPTAIRDAWAASGWERGPLGYPTGIASTTADGRAQVQAFQGGEVYASATAGARIVPTAVLGAAKAAALGLPVSAAARTPDGKATYQHFEGGSVYVTAATGARALPTVIRDAWALTGWENGPLGYPTTDVSTTPDGLGRYQHFQGGSVYWTRATGAHAVRGVVRDAWARSGWETGVLGYPLTDVTSTPDGVGQYAHFQGGAVYSTAATGARVLGNDVVRAWAGTGWERGALGYPTSDERPVAGGTRTDFQRGWIDVASGTGVATVHIGP